MCLPRSLTRPEETTMSATTADPTADSTADPVTGYVAAVPPPMREVTERLVALVDAELPGAERVLWYGHPVWRVGGQPAVLVKAHPKHVTLGFWRGRLIDSAGALTPSGGAGMASIKVTGELDRAAAARWLRQVPALHA
jgi:hypothetical protein